jgi:hypothetical protein
MGRFKRRRPPDLTRGEELVPLERAPRYGGTCRGAWFLPKPICLPPATCECSASRPQLATLVSSWSFPGAFCRRFVLGDLPLS